jgi:hypothetical protein
MYIYIYIYMGTDIPECDAQAESFSPPADPPADLELTGRWLAHINHELKCARLF